MLFYLDLKGLDSLYFCLTHGGKQCSTKGSRALPPAPSLATLTSQACKESHLLNKKKNGWVLGIIQHIKTRLSASIRCLRSSAHTFHRGFDFHPGRIFLKRKFVLRTAGFHEKSNGQGQSVSV
uniref:Uncharacterized protein n=1 Tax=Cacopsylla melanoneura TaxID=428564 RepID=A0A8D8ZBQ7_9HEMI